MTSLKKSPAPGVGRPPRSDGLATRGQLLEAAGRLYAEKGFASTTSAEICAAANASVGAVNYHFGGRDELYTEVLVEAHRRVIAVEELEAVAADAALGARARLRVAVAGMARRAEAKSEADWPVRVLARETMSPSAHARALGERAIAPKAVVVRRLVADVLGAAESDPLVHRCVAFMIGSVMYLMLAPPDLRRRLLPALDGHADAVAEDLARYVDAALQGMRRPLPRKAAPGASAARGRAREKGPRSGKAR